MSQKFHQIEPHTKKLKPSSKSGIKIEDKLLSFKVQSTKRLELLKQSIEQEKLKEMQAKPKILKKSRILAEFHEKKHFDIVGPSKVSPNLSINAEKSFPHQDKKESQNKAVNSIPQTITETTPSKSRPRSAQNHSIIERSKAWLEAKKEKIGKKKMIIEKSALAECTFSPYMQRKFKKADKDEILTPQSIETHADSIDRVKKTSRKSFVNKSLTPFKQRVSFRSGFDVEKFIKRAA